MNTLVKDWIKALKSGEYTQGQGSLARYCGKQEPHAHCCLGVLADISGEQWQPYTFFLPAHIRIKANLRSDNGVFHVPSLPKRLQKQVVALTGDKTLCSLSKLNDQGASFDLIADVIKAEPSQLFHTME